MWLIVSFDLPVVSSIEKKRATKFRKDLLNDGFNMMQYSIYTRHCASKESLEVHVKRVKRYIPPEGYVSILSITDKQYGNIINIWGRKTKPMNPAPPQMELF
jgi:CRISPR-associated protein Cas2